MKNSLLILTAALVITVLMPFRAHAYGSMFDGGELQGMGDECSCSGGETINVSSYVDNQTHTYLYQPGITQLYANYDITSSNGYFLTTLFPFAECLDASDDCAGSDGQSPEGIFILTGTSFNTDKDSVMALIKQFPMASDIVSAYSRSITMTPWKPSDPRI